MEHLQMGTKADAQAVAELHKHLIEAHDMGQDIADSEFEFGPIVGIESVRGIVEWHYEAHDEMGQHSHPTIGQRLGAEMDKAIEQIERMVGRKVTDYEAEEIVNALAVSVREDIMNTVTDVVEIHDNEVADGRGGWVASDKHGAAAEREHEGRVS